MNFEPTESIVESWVTTNVGVQQPFQIMLLGRQFATALDAALVAAGAQGRCDIYNPHVRIGKRSLHCIEVKDSTPPLVMLALRWAHFRTFGDDELLAYATKLVEDFCFHMLEHGLAVHRDGQWQLQPVPPPSPPPKPARRAAAQKVKNNGKPKPKSPRRPLRSRRS